jgi:hypothetical protein
MRYETIELVDAVEGDEVYAGGAWVAVERVHVFGSARDLVKIFFSNGGTHAGPLHHFGKARRPVVEAPAVSTYCGHYPNLDHAGCPSSVECTAISLDSPELVHVDGSPVVTDAELDARIDAAWSLVQTVTRGKSNQTIDAQWAAYDELVAERRRRASA